jgi:hypothetical protein
MNVFKSRGANRLCFFVTAALVLLALSPAAHASAARYLWQSRDQFVALERQDIASSGAALPNDHPAEPALDRLPRS